MGVSSVKKSGADAGMIAMPSYLEHVVAGELHGEVTCEAIRRLHDDGLRTVRRQPLQHLPEAWTLVDTVGTAHGLVIVVSHHGTLAKALIAARSR